MIVTTEVRIPTDNVAKSDYLTGLLFRIKATKGLVIFAHGSGSGSSSSRNQYLSQKLNNDGLSTLLVDLLTVQEQDTDSRTENIMFKLPGATLNRFNIKLLARRLITVTEWTLECPETKDLLIGYFGSSTGSAAALVAASYNNTNQRITAIVSRSGRPDLAVQSLPLVKTPTLFIVGANDVKKVIHDNENALKKIGSVKKKMVIVPKATHLFEEEGALEQVGQLASGWFRCYFQIREHMAKLVKT